jgi:hypothetical protein
MFATVSTAWSRRSAASRLSRRWVWVNSALRSAGNGDFRVGQGTARCGGVMATLLSLPHQSWPRDVRERARAAGQRSAGRRALLQTACRCAGVRRSPLALAVREHDALGG